jgi:hypothetical protein
MTAGSTGNEGSATGSGIEFPPAAATVGASWTTCIGFAEAIGVFFRTSFVFRIGFRFAATVPFGASFRFSTDFLLGVVFFIRFFRATAFFATRNGFVWRRAVVRSDPEVRFVLASSLFCRLGAASTCPISLPDLRVDFAIQDPSRS